MRKWILLVASATLGLAAWAAPASDQKALSAFENVSMTLEFNQTDGDAEVVTKISAPEGMTQVVIRFPNGAGRMLKVRSGGNDAGQTEVVIESADGSVSEVLEMYPEGIYEFEATTVSGLKLRGRATLRHTLLQGPEVRPCDGCEVLVDDAVVSWAPVAGAAGYIVVLESDEVDVDLRVRLNAATTSFALPGGFLLPLTEYKLGVASVSAEGNCTFVESTFVTAG